MQRRVSSARPAQLPRLNVPALPSASLPASPAAPRAARQSPSASSSQHAERLHGHGWLFFYRFVTTRDKWLLVLGVIAAAVSGALFPAAPLAIVGRALDDVALATDSNAIERATRDLAYAAFGMFVLDYVASFCIQTAVKCETRRLRCHAFRHALQMTMEWHDARAENDLTRRLSTRSMQRIELVVGQRVRGLARDVAQLVLAAVVAYTHATQFPTESLLVGVPVVAAADLLIQKERKQLLRDDNFSTLTMATLAQIRTIASLNGQDSALAAAHKAQKRPQRNAIERWAVTCVFRACFVLSMGLAVRNVMCSEERVVDFSSTPSASDVLQIVAAICGGTIAAVRIVFAFPSIREALNEITALFEILRGPVDGDSGRAVPARCQGEVEFKTVHLNHPMDPATPVLQNFNLRIPPGATVALVSANADTTSAVASLMQRFYDPQRGEITLDGTDIEDLSVSWLRAQISIVASQPALFEGTKFENIALGAVDVTHDQVEAAARRAGVHDWIQALPEQYHTNVGEIDGEELTASRRRLIALARAFARNPRILIVEETTMGIDAVGNNALVHALSSTSTKTAPPTMLVVSGRAGSALLRQAHKIVVFSSGTVAEIGTHDELMARRNGVYKSIHDEPAPVVHAQFAGEHRQYVTDWQPETEPSGGDVTSQRPTSVLAIVWLTSRTLVSFICVGGVVVIAAVAYLVVLLADLVNLVATIHLERLHSSDSTPQTLDAFVRDAIRDFKWCVAAGVVAAFASLSMNFALGWAQIRLTGRVRSRFLRALLYQRIPFFDEKDHSPSALAAKLSRHSDAVASVVGEDLGISVVAGFALLGAMGVLFSCTSLSSFVGLLAMIAFHVGVRWHLHRCHQPRPELTEPLRADQFLSHRLANIRTVVSLGLEQVSADAFYNLVPEQKPHLAAHRHGFACGLGTSFVIAAWALALLYGSTHASGRTDKTNDPVDLRPVVSVFVSVSLALLTSHSCVGSLATTKDNARSATSAMSSISALEVDAQNSKVGTRPPSVQGAITLRGVTFQSPSRSRACGLQRCDLAVPAGETLGVCATSVDSLYHIVDLLEHFYDPASGVVSLDGRDVRTLSVSWLRDQIGVIGRDTLRAASPWLFPGTIAENIAYGLSYEPTRRKIEEVARLVGAHDAIMALPRQYDSCLATKQAPSGNQLARRIAIARVLIKNPSILVVDDWDGEATSEDYCFVLRAILKVKKRTTILLTRRPTTLQLADQVCVVHEGRVVEQGTHRELLESGALFKSIVIGESREHHGKRAFARRLFGLS